MSRVIWFMWKLDIPLGACMLLLINRVTEILAGYDVAKNADARLMDRWRPRLLAAYAERRKAFDTENQAY